MHSGQMDTQAKCQEAILSTHDPYFSIATARLLEAEQAALSRDRHSARNEEENTSTPVEPEVRRMARHLRDLNILRAIGI